VTCVGPPHLHRGPNTEGLSVEEGRPCAGVPDGETIRENFVVWRIAVQIQDVWMCLQMHQPFLLLQLQTQFDSLSQPRLSNESALAFWGVFPVNHIFFSKSASSAGYDGWRHKCNGPLYADTYSVTV